MASAPDGRRAFVTPIDESTSARELAQLPAPDIDPAFAARVQRRARSTLHERNRLRLDDAAVPALLLLAGAFYTVTSFELMLRIFGSG